MNDQEIGASIPLIKRLPLYLRLLDDYRREGMETVSSTRIAEDLKLEPIQVRKDLAATGIIGKPGVGFPMETLIQSIKGFLGWDNATEAFLVGTGNLGTALMGYEGFERFGLRIIAGFDVDPDKIGTKVHGKSVLPLAKLGNLARRMHIHIGVLAVPAAAAQDCAELMAESGILAIWNFTPVTISVPEGLIVENVDLASSLAVLSRKLFLGLRSRNGSTEGKRQQEENG